MQITKTKQAFSGWVLLFLITIVFLLAGCKTEPIHDRNFSERGGFWEQDENANARFYHNSGTGKSVIGHMYKSSRSAFLNGAQVKVSSKIKNAAMVNTGPHSSARVEFKATDSSCSVRIEAFDFGNAYSDSSDCQHTIETPHARIHAKNAILHINASSSQTEVTVISGVIKVVLRNNATQSVRRPDEGRDSSLGHGRPHQSRLLIDPVAAGGCGRVVGVGAEVGIIAVCISISY